jgi:hypothetical protein
VTFPVMRITPFGPAEFVGVVTAPAKASCGTSGGNAVFDTGSMTSIAPFDRSARK